MGVSVAEGTVVEWHKQAGDWVQADETICEISTDKIDTEVPSPASGRVAEIVVAMGETVPVGSTLARIATDGASGEPPALEQVEPPALEQVEPPAAAPSARNGRSPAAAEDAPPAASLRRHYSPVVQRIAEQHGIDLDNIEGTGRGGRVRKQDVLAAVQSSSPVAAPAPLHIESPYREAEQEREPEPQATAQPAAPAVPAAAIGDGDVSRPLSRMRSSIGEHMLRSLRTAAHCTTIVEVDMSRVEAARAPLGLSYLPFVARATIDALREFPALNSTLEGDILTTHANVNLGIAVSLGEEGLIVPVLERAQELSVEGLGARIAELAARARSGALTPDEVRGGTFTITNPGAFGAIAATPIINQPQVAILDLETVVKRPVVIDDGAGGDAIAIRPIANLCLSWDHRALDGALAAQFLAAVRRRIQPREAKQ
jgi:pyruvate/2-oxoglutarate dehydrogenase complex dihydrolipoamide acyltransferase (E2) component